MKDGTPPTNIDETLGRFLTQQQCRLSPRTYQNYRSVISLLRHCLNEYGPSYLVETELAEWREAYRSDEGAFCRLFGPDRISYQLHEFVHYFLPRKVGPSAELSQAAGVVTRRLARWLDSESLTHSRALKADLPRPRTRPSVGQRLD